MKQEMVEGPQAKENFDRAMKAAFSVSKKEIEVAEKREKAKRKHKKN